MEAKAWLGYTSAGERVRLGLGELGSRVLLLGSGAGALSTLFAFAGREAGSRTVVVDLDGSVDPGVQGYFRRVDYRALLYDAVHLQGEDCTHGQLVSSAYSTALDLSGDEESIIGAALQKLSEQNDLAGPTSLFDALGAVEGFRGFYVDRLKGRIGALKMMSATQADEVKGLLAGRMYIGFASAPYPLAAELAAALILAKLLYLMAGSSERPGSLIVTGTQRLFKNTRRLQHGDRLLASLLEAPVPIVLASPLPALLDSRLVDSVPVRAYSCEAWNAARSMRQLTALPGSFVICDDRSGASETFFPRFVRNASRAGGEREAPIHAPADPDLTRSILEEISRYDTANRQSVVSYLTPLFLAADVEGELTRLQELGHLIVEPKKADSGSSILAYTVTESGRMRLEELRK
jgi:hypothetical protein